MSRTALFWGIVFILLGVVLGLQAAGIISGSVWGYIWALLLIFLGIWVISSIYYKPKYDEAHKFTVSRKDARQAEITFDFGAASLAVTGGASPDAALEGLSGTTLDLRTDYLDDKVTIQVNAGPSFIPFLGPDGWSWRFKLNNDIPMALKFDSGASSIDLDLSDVKVSRLNLETGASSSKVVLPAQAGKTLVEVEGGAATFDIRVPEGVAARIRILQGASSVRVDENRFPVTSRGLYQSPDYDTAQNSVELILETGAGSFNIH
jgi:hypothetical protein